MVLEGQATGTHDVLEGYSQSTQRAVNNTHAVLDEYTHPFASLRSDGLRDRTHWRPCADVRAAMGRPIGPV